MLTSNNQTFSSGRLTGQALVEFADGESLNLALSKNRQHMGSRYLEVNRSDKSEMDRLTEKSETVSSKFSFKPKVKLFNSFVTVLVKVT